MTLEECKERKSKSEAKLNSEFWSEFNFDLEISYSDLLMKLQHGRYPEPELTAHSLIQTHTKNRIGYDQKMQKIYQDYLDCLKKVPKESIPVKNNDAGLFDIFGLILGVASESLSGPMGSFGENNPFGVGGSGPVGW